MRRHVPALLLLLLQMTLACPPAETLWRSLQSDSFLLFYPAGRQQQALQALVELERARPYVAALVGSAGRRRLAVVLVDAGAQSNGYADPAYRRLHLYLYPPADPDLGFAPSWWALVGAHEYAHWLHLTSASGLPGVLTRVFGDAWAPGVFGPAWLAEGLAVYAESSAGPYQGRLNAGFYDAYLEELLRAGRPPALPQALFAPADFPGAEAPYLFGGQFVDHLARAYGQEAVTGFLQDGARSALSYLSPLLPLAGVDRSARRAFGKRTRELWRDWLQTAAGDAAAGGAEAATAGDAGAGPPQESPQEPPQEPPRASRAAWWMGTPVPHGDRIWFLRSLPFPAGPFRQSWRHELRELGPAGERTLARFASSFSADLKWREGRLYFGLQELERGLANVELLGYGACTVLYALDPDSGRRERLLRAPLRAYEVLPGGDVVFARDRAEAFGSEILLWKRRPAQGEANPRLLAVSEFLVREILAGEGRVFVSARRHGSNFGLFEVDPGTLRLSPILPGPWAAGGLDFTGGRLRFAANYDGRSAVYSWDPVAARAVRLSSAPYALRPAADPGAGLLWYVGLAPDGYVLRGEPLQPPAETSTDRPAEPAAGTAPEAGPPAAVAVPPVPAFRAGGYAPNLATLAPRLLVPVLAADPAGGGYLAGATVLGRSALGDIAWSVSGLVDLATGLPAAEASLQLLLPPLSWSLAASTLGQGWLGTAVELPVLRRLAPVGRSLELGLAAYLYSAPAFTGRALEPFLDFGLDAALLSLAGRAAFWLERVEWGASENLASLEAELTVERFLRCGALRAAFAGFRALAGGEGELDPLRGYGQGLEGGAGAAANLDFFLRLLRIRSGTWNPPFYLQDVYLVPFLGGALSDRQQLQAASGLELHWELKALAVGTGLPLELAAGLAVNAEGGWSLYAYLSSPLQGLPLARPRPGRMR